MCRLLWNSVDVCLSAFCHSLELLLTVRPPPEHRICTMKFSKFTLIALASIAAGADALLTNPITGAKTAASPT